MSLTLRIGVTPVVGSEFYWSINEGGSVRSGFVVIDLARAWDAQADLALPKGFVRVSPWDVTGEHAVAEIGPVKRAVAARVDTAYPTIRATHRRATESALAAFFARMRADVAARHDDGVSRLIAPRWNQELADLLLELNLATASDVAVKVAAALDSEYDPAIMTGWFESNSELAADRINSHAESDIRDSEDDDPVGHVFGILESSGAAQLAVSMVTTAAGFGARDAAEKSGAAAKTWRVNSGNPRSSHQRLNGETVSLSENFSNGMAWPGDPDGGADENAQCQCSLTIVS